MCKLTVPNKKAGWQAGGYGEFQRIPYHPAKGSSSPNHKFFLTMGRHVFERPANWNVRLRK